MTAISCLNRRAVLCAAMVGCTRFTRRSAAATTTIPNLLAARVTSTGELAPPSAGMESREGDLRYPPWLEGTWRVLNTNGNPTISLPLGPKFVDPLLIEEANAGATSRRYLMRFVKADAADLNAACGPLEEYLTVRQDRRFNTMQEEGAFTAPAGFLVERGAYACDAAHPHGSVLLERLDTDATAAIRARASAPSGTPSQTYEVIQKTALRSRSELDIVWAAAEATDDGGFVTSELVVQREMLPTGEELSTSFLELLTKFESPRQEGERASSLRAHYRVLQYLSLPGMPRSGLLSRAERALEREAAGRAVAVLDYGLVLERVS